MKKVFLFFAVVFASINGISYAEDNNVSDELSVLVLDERASEDKANIDKSTISGTNEHNIINDNSYGNNNKQDGNNIIETNVRTIPDENNFIQINDNKQSVAYNLLRSVILNKDILPVNKDREIIKQMQDEKIINKIINNNDNYKTKKIFMSKKDDYINKKNTLFSSSYFNNSFFRFDGGIGFRDMLILDVFGMDFSDAIMFQQENGNYIEDNWKLSNKNSFQLRYSANIGYAHAFTTTFKPYIGAYFVMSIPFSAHSYQKTFSNDYDTPGLKNLSIQENFNHEVGIKLGNVIEATNSIGPWLPYITIGYSNIDWDMYSLEKVAKKVETTVNGVTEKEDKLEDKNDSVQGHTTAHFATFGFGVEKYFLFFKIALYAKYYYPLNNISFRNEIGNLVDFGKHSHVSVGVTFGFMSLPITF